jgi:predicted dehydrogenase
MQTLRTAAIGVGSLGKQHARVHRNLADEGLADFVAVCDSNEATARAIAAERNVEWTTDWQSLIGTVDAVSLATTTESHCEIACGLLAAGVHVLVEKPIARTLEEADRMIAAAAASGACLMVGQLERYNRAMVALRPHVKGPLYFEIHRIGAFTARSLDIDVVLDLMIHDLDMVQWLTGEDVAVEDVRAVGLPVLTKKVDAANARIEFANGTVANITASRIGMEKIRKMRFFQPYDFVAVDYATGFASLSGLGPPQGGGIWPSVRINRLDTVDIEPLRAEIEAFIRAAQGEIPVPITGADGRRALALAIQVLDRIDEHAKRSGLNTLKAQSDQA